MLRLFDDIAKGAWFSPCRTWRYSLWRRWHEPEPGQASMLNFVMLNPSTADEEKNDPTVERCERRARSLGFDGLIVTNLFAFRATDPRVMKRETDPIGPANDTAILEAATTSDMVICAWGNDGAFKGRSADVLRLLREHFASKIHALKVSQIGEPMHPLYLSYELQPVPL